MNVMLIEGANLRERARALGGQSRSYCEPYALVAFHDGPVGVDIERVVECDARFAASIVTPDETVPETDAEIISLWSAKEALAKALGDAVDYDPRRLRALSEGVTGAWHAEPLPLPDGFTGWVCWR
ncbi:4'-phosphopantetheinyl transferase superfamily protein [Solirubrobacter phytolaccae]|uniref:4'-phosphopantetheinyl transferase superfamily protein n=1 Tax=Solirubrobacter phytolaccae TaxID=1404360 RepID=A0A9X3N5U4_9ACTN|nr:4'-phosphopantetheinyl transferase superfamily protein [Solirubrobacter phytolaccae]MDA0180031.1 4'-phosphopantetheinyl transferase superfamily protein [Solirubrobacter phytolaccae]